MSGGPRRRAPGLCRGGDTKRRRMSGGPRRAARASLTHALLSSISLVITASVADGDPSGTAGWGRELQSPRDFTKGCSSQERQKSKKITEEVMRARSADVLLTLIQDHHSEMDPVNANAAWRKLLLGGLQQDKRWLVAVEVLVARALALLDREERGRSLNHNRFGPREVSNWLHALAKSGAHDTVETSELLIAALERRALATMPAWNGQDVGNFLWAFATMARKPSPRLLAAVQLQALKTARSFSPQLISNSLWAFATLKTQPAEHLFAELSLRAEVTSVDFNAQNLANTLWAHATLERQPSELLMVSLAARAEDVVGEMNAQNVANFLWSFSKLGVSPTPQLWERLEARALMLMHAFTPQLLSNFMLSLAILGWAPREDLLQAMVGRLHGTAAHFNPQDLANSFWAMAVFLARGVPCFKLSKALGPLAKRTQEIHQSDFLPEHLSALHQFALACEKKGRMHAQADEHAYPQELASLFIFDNQTQSRVENFRRPSNPLKTSRSQMQVARALESLGFSVRSEVHCPVSGLSIDLSAARRQDPDCCDGLSDVIAGNSVFAVEFDGPLHFNTPLGSDAKAARFMTGATELKHYLLRKLGHTLVAIPYWEWDAVANNDAAETEYLVRRLHLHLDHLPPEVLQAAAARLRVFTRQDFLAAKRDGRLSRSVAELQEEQKGKAVAPPRAHSNRTCSREVGGNGACSHADSQHSRMSCAAQGRGNGARSPRVRGDSVQGANCSVSRAFGHAWDMWERGQEHGRQGVEAGRDCGVKWSRDAGGVGAIHRGGGTRRGRGAGVKVTSCEARLGNTFAALERQDSVNFRESYC